MDLIEHLYVGSQTELGDVRFQDIGEVHYFSQEELYQSIGVGKAPFLTRPLFDSINFDKGDLQNFRKDFFYGVLPDHWNQKVAQAHEVFRQYHLSVVEAEVARLKALEEAKAAAAAKPAEPVQYPLPSEDPAE